MRNFVHAFNFSKIFSYFLYFDKYLWVRMLENLLKMDNLVKVQWFGIIWYQDWLPKIIRSWVVSIFVGTPFYFLTIS